MKGIFKFIEKYFFIIILLAVAVSLVYPNSFQWVLSNYNGINVLNLLLSMVLFTMGTTLKVDDFVNVFRNPKEIGVGISAQYIVMPIIAFALARVFSLSDALTVGLILVGTVPGGTASDVITFLSNGDVAL
uniref:bile acid:sodium symporter family protein n=1 Tax=Methanobrevibacter sp. TaxID=66852 RepID=UPI00386C8C03